MTLLFKGSILISVDDFKMEMCHAGKWCKQLAVSNPTFRCSSYSDLVGLFSSSKSGRVSCTAKKAIPVSLQVDLPSLWTIGAKILGVSKNQVLKNGSLEIYGEMVFVCPPPPPPFFGP